jgi:hypothetical protein
MHRSACLLAALLVLPLLGSDSPKDYNDSTVLEDAFLGVWTRATLRIDGNERALPDGWTITIRTGSFSESVGANSGLCRIEHGSPNRLTVTSPKEYQFLFRVEGETLILGYYNGGVGRPKGWDDPAIHVSTFKRVKK